MGWTCEKIARAGMLLLATLTAGGLVTWVLKNIVARARPEVLLDDGIYGMGRMFAGSPFNSFPSSHTQTAFAVAAVLASWRRAGAGRRWRWPRWWRSAGSSNRDHYLSDVRAAALIAVVAAYAIKPYVLSPSHTWPLRAPGAGASAAEGSAFRVPCPRGDRQPWPQVSLPMRGQAPRVSGCM